MIYKVKPEYFSEWGEDVNEETVITEQELERLSREWDKPIEELISELLPMEFGVSLANKEVIFDSAVFDTISEVMDFISGRGGVYVAHISNNSTGKTISLSYNDDTGIYSMYDGWEWQVVSSSDIRGMIG